MSRFRRHFLAGAPVFITAVCRDRRPLLSTDTASAHLLQAMREARSVVPYRMLGWVILPDHFHWLVCLEDAPSLPRLMQGVKLRVARRCGRAGTFWQRRYWDHHIRDRDDLRRHLDYIHFNPVRHGCASAPADHRWSSFRAYVARGRYPATWGEADPGIEDTDTARE